MADLSRQRTAFRDRFGALLDPFLIALVGTVLLASLLPCRGEVAALFDVVTAVAIAFLFFLHGAKLSRQAILAGIGHWRLHAVVLAATFIMFPLIGIAFRGIFHPWVAAALLDGVVFLCLLPSTVQSSIAFTSIAGGNVPAAVCSASASNVLGMVLTPVLVGVILGGSGGKMPLHSIESIALQLLAPFIAGHLSRPLISKLITRHKSLVAAVDRGSILLVVYAAFSAAVVEGLWRSVSAGDLATVFVLDSVILTIALGLTNWSSRALGFAREDRIAVVFCGSKKSLASGVPMAGVLFPPASVGITILPLMVFHQIQLMVCAVLARRYAAANPAMATDEITHVIAK